jgi:hypothetical protein
LHGSLRGRSDRHTGRRDFLCEQVSGDKGHCEQKTSKERFHEGIWKLLVHLNKGSQCFLLQKSCAPCNLIYKNLSVANPRIWISKPTECTVNKFIRGRGVATAALPVEGPTKNELRRTIMVSSRRSQWLTSVDFPTPAQATIVTNVDILICPCTIQKSDILLSTKNVASCNR